MAVVYVYWGGGGILAMRGEYYPRSKFPLGEIYPGPDFPLGESQTGGNTDWYTGPKLVLPGHLV